MKKNRMCTHASVSVKRRHEIFVAMAVQNDGAMGATVKGRVRSGLATTLTPALAKALSRILPGSAMAALQRAAANGDAEALRDAMEPAIAQAPAGSRRRKLLAGALALLTGGAALAGLRLRTMVMTRANETQYQRQERLFPTSRIGQAAPYNPATAAAAATPPDWETYVARLGPSAASATTVGVPEAPSDLLRRVQDFKASRMDLDNLDLYFAREANLRAAVAFWNSYWAEKYAPLLRWVRSDANKSVLDTMTAAEAEARGQGQLYRARKRVVHQTDRAIRRHFAFFDKLKQAVQGTSLQGSLSAYTDRATEWELAKLEKGIPSRTAYLHPDFPPVNDPSEALPERRPSDPAGAGADPFLASPHATLAARHAKAGALNDVGTMVEAGAASLPTHWRQGILPCGPLAEFCSAGDLTDSKVAAIREIWDDRFYASGLFGKYSRRVLRDIHGSVPVRICQQILDFDGHDLGMTVPWESPVEMVAEELRDAVAAASFGETPVTKVVFPLSVPGHAEAMVVDLATHDVTVFDPHGRLLLDEKDASGEMVRTFEAAIRGLLEDPLVVAATGGTPLRVHDLRGRAADIVAGFGILPRWDRLLGPQVLQNARGTSSHEGSCQLWSLWFTHLVAQYPTLSLDRALETGVRGILENADVDDSVLAKVFDASGWGSTLTEAEQVRVGDVMTRFIHKFATQLMSLMPEDNLRQDYARMLLWWGSPAALREASTFASGDASGGAPKDVRQRARDILRTLAPPAGAAVTEPNLHRLWRLRQGLRSPRYVDAAAAEAFGPFHAGREEQVLQFLDSTRFLDKMHAQGADLGPTLASAPDGMMGVLHRAWDAVAGRSPSSASGDSYRGEVATGTFA
jgi:hypothetical protein